MKQAEIKKALDFHTKMAQKSAVISDINVLIKHIISEIVDYIDADSGSIMVYSKQEESLKLYVSSDHPKNQPGKGPVASVSADDGIAGEVFKTGKAIAVKDVESLKDKIKLRRKNDMGSFLSIPLKLHRKIVAVLNLNRQKDKKPFASNDLNKLKAINALIANLIEKERLIRDISENRKEISALYECLCKHVSWADHLV